MQQAERLSILKNTIIGFSKVLGEHTEIALHDLEKKELYFIINGHVTGRKIGYKMNPSVYDTILQLADEDNCVIGYASHGPAGNNLRASHIIFRDESGEPVALICINQDISVWEGVRDLIDELTRCRSLRENHAEQNVADENHIQNITRQIILDTVESAKPSVLDTKQEKMKVLHQLELKGIFAVKDAVPIVCKMLSISQATLYNYLRELRCSDDF